MQRPETKIVILTQNSQQAGKDIPASALRLFSSLDFTADVAVLEYAKPDRVHTLNIWLNENLDGSAQYIVLDADQLPQEPSSKLTRYAQEHPADVFCCCDPSPKHTSFAANRSRYVQYLCEQSAVLWLSEKAVRRMQTADTTDLIQEALADDALSVEFVPQEVYSGLTQGGLRRRLCRIGCFVNMRRLLLCGAAAALLASIVLLLLWFRKWSAIYLIGGILCVHVFLFALGVLLVRWYRNSVRLEQKKREHSYVEETLAK